MMKGMLLFTVGAALARDSIPPRAPASVSANQHGTREGPAAFEAEFAASNAVKSGDGACIEMDCAWIKLLGKSGVKTKYH